jgi:CMP-N-acetylneuraminic acid synthetase
MNIICVISARGGSKGVKGKNMRPILGKPLIAWSIEQALACPDIARVIVSTDSGELANIARSFGAEVPFIRPAELSNDTAGKWEVWQHALKECEQYYKEEIDLYVDLDCTSPLRDIKDISAAIKQFKNSNVDAVFSVCDARKNPYFNMVEIENNCLNLCKNSPKPIIRRQDAPKVYEHVASIYVLSPDYLRTGNSLLSGCTQGYHIDQTKSLDVDSEFDFEVVEYLMKKNGFQ